MLIPIDIYQKTFERNASVIGHWQDTGVFRGPIIGGGVLQVMSFIHIITDSDNLAEGTVRVYIKNQK